MNYLNIIKQNWQTITLVTLVLVVLSLVFSLVQPFEYKSRVEFLIVQKQTYNLDAYAATRASEKMASNLASIIKTKSFYDKVMAGSFGISRANFPNDEIKLRKAWQDKISTQVFPETSILSVDIFDKNKREADKIAKGVAGVLVNDSAEYHGGSDVSIKVVNQPLVSNHPVRPNIVLNTLAGLVLGLVISLSWVFYNTHSGIQDLIAEDSEYNAGDSEEYRKNQIRNIFEPQIKTMRDDLPDYEEI